MNMKCRNLSELKSFEHIRLVAGEDGLDHTITWVYINQDSSIIDWIHGGELVFITGMEDGFSDKTLIAIVRECLENAASGVVILLSPDHIKAIPDEVIEIANNGALPLYEMPWELKLVDVTKEIADTIIMNQFHERSVMGFFSELLFSHSISDSTVKSMGIRCGVDVDSNAAIVIIRPELTEGYSHFELDNTLSSLSRTVEDRLFMRKINSVSYINIDEIFCFVVCNSTEELRDIRRIISEICRSFSEKNSGLGIFGGIGRITSGAKNFRKSYSEARRALEISEKDGNSICISLFSELGIIRLLTSADDSTEVKNYCFSTLSPLIDSDRQHNTEYVKTLEVYLQNNCNLVKASEAMFIHRNTMVYRIEKIRSLLGIDFNDMTAKSECMNALRIMKHFGFSINDFN